MTHLKAAAGFKQSVALSDGDKFGKARVSVFDEIGLKHTAFGVFQHTSLPSPSIRLVVVYTADFLQSFSVV